MHRLLWFALSAAFLVFTVVRAEASLSINDYAMTAKLLNPPAHLQINIAGLSEFDKKAWKIEKQDDGSELYTLAKNTGAKNAGAKSEARAAITRNAKGDVESMTTYQLNGKGVEQAAALLFDKGSLQAFTSCEEQDSVGRVCVTATPDLCHALKVGNVRPEDMKAMETDEMRSLANLLTLRGADHQLDNLAHSGNKLGLKTALQTTKGQLLALAKEISKERTPSSQIAPSAPSTDEKLAQTILEKSLPRLKQACVDTSFAN